MNLLTITDIKFAGASIKIEELANYLRKRMEKQGIQCEMKVKKDGIDIIQNSEKKLFMSVKENYIPLKEGDSRIQKNGRDYLKSQRLSQRQLKELQKIFSLYLDMIHVSCSIKLYASKENMSEFIELRDINNNNFLTKWPMPENFPLERT